MLDGPDVPRRFHHIVAKKTFEAAAGSGHFDSNALQVVMLQVGGEPCPNHNPAYFPVHKVKAWIGTHCMAKSNRKKHVVSSLEKANQMAAASTYAHGPVAAQPV